VTIDWPDWTAGNVDVVQLAGANAAVDVQVLEADLAVAAGVETVVLTSALLDVQVNPAFAVIVPWVQETVAAGSNTFAVRRGALVTDPLVGEANPEAIEVAIGSIFGRLGVVTEALFDAATVRYSFTVLPSGNSTVRQAGLLIALF